MGIEQEHRHYKSLLQAHQRRLHVLELQAALFGANTPPGVIIEIEDLRVKIAQIKADAGNTVSAEVVDVSQRWLSEQASSAFFQEDWSQAEQLYLQVLKGDPDNATAQKRLIEIQCHLEQQSIFRTICGLRDKERWPQVLAALDYLDQLNPTYPGAATIRRWAEGERQRAQSCNTILDSISTCITALDLLSRGLPNQADSQALLADARAFQQVVEAFIRSLYHDHEEAVPNDLI